MNAADAWAEGLLACVESLAQFPSRCGLAPESRELDFEVGQMLYGNKHNAYRILYQIFNDDPVPAVTVLQIRHSAQDQIKPGELMRKKN